MSFRVDWHTSLRTRVRTGIRAVRLALMLALSPAALLAQTGTLSGLVSDSAKVPLPGAQVTVVGTRFGATSGLDGRYRIVGVPAGAYTAK